MELLSNTIDWNINFVPSTTSPLEQSPEKGRLEEELRMLRMTVKELRLEKVKAKA